MPDNAPAVLITRPTKQAEEFRKLLPSWAEVIISPIVKIEPLKVEVDLGDFDGLVLTSQNGLRALDAVRGLRGLKVYVVGERTAQLAADLGADIQLVRSSATRLLSAIVAGPETGKLLVVRGVHARIDLEAGLRNASIETHSAILYDQVAQPLTQQARAAVASDTAIIVPLFSPRSSALLSAEIANSSSTAKLRLVPISMDAADAWVGPKPEECQVAATPTAKAVANVIYDMLNRTA